MTPSLISNHPSLLSLVILTLAVFRVTRLVVTDDITEPARLFLQFRSSPRGNQTLADAWGDADHPAYPRRFLRGLLDCHWCTGVWVAGVLTHAAAWRVDSRTIITSLAVAGLAGIIETRL